MASKAQTKQNTDWNWEDFRPEWANEGIERINAELEQWGDQLQSRSEKFRLESEKRIEKGIKQVQTELGKLPGAKRAAELRQELETRVEQNIETGVDKAFTTLGLARLDEVKKLERKITRLNKKLRDLEKKK